MFGPREGRQHDSGTLKDSGLLNKLQQNSFGPTGNLLCIYGDPAYPLRMHLQAPFRGPGLARNEMLFNNAMSKVRISIEWVFGDIINYFAFLDFKKDWVECSWQNVHDMCYNKECTHLLVSFHNK